MMDQDSRQNHANADDLAFDNDEEEGIPEHRAVSFKRERVGFSLFSREPSIGSAFSISALLLLLFYLVMTYLPDSAWIVDKTSLIGFSVISSLFYLLVFLVPIVIFVYYQHIPDKKILGTNPGIGIFLLSALAGIPFAVMLTALQNLFVYYLVINEITFPSSPFVYQTVDTSSEAQALAFIVSILIPIFMEELLFRGFFFSAWPEKSFSIPKILISAILFTAFSLRPETAVTTFILGLLLGFIRQFSGNTLCCVLTRLSAVVSVFVFSRFLPVLQLSGIRGKAEFDRTILYTSVVAFIICFMVSIPVLSQIFVSGREGILLRHENEPEADVSFLKGLDPVFFFCCILLVSCAWIFLVGF
jgi:membrane protease YdiL (CAAX protease family)